MTDARRIRPEVSRRGLLAAAGLAGAVGLSGCSGRAGTVAAELPVVMDAPSARVDIMAVGDMLVHEGVWQSGALAGGGFNFDHLFAHLADEFLGADVAIINQESVLGGAERGLESFPYFNSPQEIGDAMAAAGVDVVLSATNHTLDQGYEGVLWTLDYWRAAHSDMVVAGIADSAEAAREVGLVEHGGLKVTVLNYTQFINEVLPPEDAPWCVSMLARADLEGDVRRAREAGADVVVACPHWGTEYVFSPVASQRAWAARLVEAGVDAIIGSHPHVLQPLEYLERVDGARVPVFWSLGNYASWQLEKPCMVGGMAKLSFGRRDGRVELASCELVPIVTHKVRGPAMGVFRLDEYTDELASQNAIREAPGCGDFSLGYCWELVGSVMGTGEGALSA